MFEDQDIDDSPNKVESLLWTLRFFWFFWLPPTVVTGFLGWILYDEGLLFSDPVTALIVLGASWLFVFTVCFGIRFGWGG